MAGERPELLTCPSCGVEIQKDGFCPYCGAAVTNQEKEAGFKYCSKCGTPLEEQEGEDNIFFCPMCQRVYRPESSGGTIRLAQPHVSPSNEASQSASIFPHSLLNFPGPWELIGIPISRPLSGRPFPVDLAKIKFNWGAFFLVPFWAFSHRLYVWGFICLFLWLVLLFRGPESFGATVGGLSRGSLLGIEVFLWIVGLWLGLKGNQLAWTLRSFKDSTQFKAVQRKWFLWGWGTVAVLLSLDFLFTPQNLLRDALSTFLPVYYLFP